MSNLTPTSADAFGMPSTLLCAGRIRHVAEAPFTGPKLIAAPIHSTLGTTRVSTVVGSGSAVVGVAGRTDLAAKQGSPPRGVPR